MNRLGDDDDVYVALVIVLAIAAVAIGLRLAGKYADRVARERVQLEIESGDYSASSEGKEVRKFKTRAALALLLCVGCAEASPGDPGGAGGFVRTGPRVADDGGLGDVRAPSDLALVDLVPPAPDVGGDLATMADAAPVNVSAPLPPASVAWLSALPDCVGVVIRGYGAAGLALGADRCEGWTIRGVRCVECAGIPGAADRCRSTGGCSTGESTSLVCVPDCAADCERAPRFCPPEVSR